MFMMFTHLPFENRTKHVPIFHKLFVRICKSIVSSQNKMKTNVGPAFVTNPCCPTISKLVSNGCF